MTFRKPLSALALVTTACSATPNLGGSDDIEMSGAEPTVTERQAFNPAIDASKGHGLITKKAFDILNARDMLAPELKNNPRALELLTYGNYFADKQWAGFANGPLTAQNARAMPHAMSDVGPSFGPLEDGGSFEDGLFHANAAVKMTWKQLAPAEPLLPSIALTLNIDVHGGLGLGGVDVLAENMRPQTHAVDNLYHYAHGDLRDLGDAAIGDGETRVRLYPFDSSDAGAPEFSDRLVNQQIAGGADYGVTKYGAILFQLARKFFVNSPYARPDINELQKVGNSVPGWHTGAVQGHGDFDELFLELPHTFLGGMPYVCTDGFSRDRCATGNPTWPTWIKADPTSTDLQALKAANPPRSDQAALIYLGWATHMIQDASAPHHAANWTGNEHEAQDGLADNAFYYSDFSNLPQPFSQFGQYFVERRFKGELDALLGPVNAKRNTADICRSLGITDEIRAAGSLQWKTVQPVFLGNLRRAYEQRRVRLPEEEKLAAGANYVGNAVLGTIKLLLCAPPNAAASAPAAKRPRVFEHFNFQGKVQSLDTGMYDMLFSGPRAFSSMGNDQISSIRVPTGYSVRLFDAISLLGASEIASSDRTQLTLNDRASSIFVTRNGESGSFFLRLKRDWFQIQPRNVGFERFVEGNQGTVSTRALTGSKAQQWRHDPDTRAIRNVESGLCLDVRGGSTADGAQVDAFTCHGGTNQQWTFGQLGQIQGVGSGRCLSVNATGDGMIFVGQALVIKACTAAENQVWEMSYACAHDPCTTGGPLTASCSVDVADQCAADASCCSSSWHSGCVQGLKSRSPGTCQ